MQRLIDTLETATSVNTGDEVVVNKSGNVLKKVPNYILGSNVVCNPKYNSGTALFTITSIGTDGYYISSTFFAPGGDIQSATIEYDTYDYTGTYIVPKIMTVVTNTKTFDRTTTEKSAELDSNFKVDNLNNIEAGNDASVLIVPLDTSTYKGSTVVKFTIQRVMYLQNGNKLKLQNDHYLDYYVI